MSNIFEELERILKSVNEADEVKVKKIPINPEMETEKQGRKKALEKLAKYFYELTVAGSTGGPSMNDDIDLPDDWIDPKLKGKMSGKFQDKQFDKNKVIWDEEQEDKLEKEVNIDMTGESDEFDDFDYRDNEFGDDPDTSDLDTDDMEGGGSGSGGDSDKTEQERLQDAINDAIDKIRDEKNSSSNGSDQQSGGQQSGGQQSGSEEQFGNEGGENQGGEGQQSSGEGGQQSGHGHQSGQGSSQTSKDKKLSELKDALERGDFDGVKDTVNDMKEGEDGSGALAGEQMGKVSDGAFNNDMKKSGFSDSDINEMGKMKDDDTSKDINEDDLRQLQKDVVKGLEDKCKKRGGSALARTIVKNAMKKKIENAEWRKLLKLFLKSKAVMNGDMAKSRNRIKFGHKNHLWRDAMLPTKTYGHGQIQNIYCFVDFSGSVNQDLVYTFLGKVIDLCQELNYTNVIVYGVGTSLTLPREITKRMLKIEGKDVVLSQTWDYIQKQNPGAGGTDFYPVSKEILEIRKKQKDAVYLVFGDAFWSTYETMPLKNNLGERICDRICMLLYYMPESESAFAQCVAELSELVGIKNIITTKASSIRE